MASVLVEEDLADSLLIELDTVSQQNLLRVQMNNDKRVSTDPIFPMSMQIPLMEMGENNQSMNEPTKEMIANFGKQIEGRFKGLQQALLDYRESLEFTQKLIDDLKKENLELRTKMGDLEMEEKRNEYQVKKMDEKLDRQDT